MERPQKVESITSSQERKDKLLGSGLAVPCCAVQGQWIVDQRHRGVWVVPKFSLAGAHRGSRSMGRRGGRCCIFLAPLLVSCNYPIHIMSFLLLFLTFPLRSNSDIPDFDNFVSGPREFSDKTRPDTRAIEGPIISNTAIFAMRPHCN